MCVFQLDHPKIIEPISWPDQLVGVQLVGKAMDHLPYFIYTFERMGQHNGIGKGRGKFEVEKVTWIDNMGDEKELYDGRQKILTSSFQPLSLSVLSHHPLSTLSS